MDLDEYLRKLGLKTMFNIKDDELDELKKDYYIFMNHVKALEVIDTEGIEPMCYPYEIETSYLRDDSIAYTISKDDALSNSKDVLDDMVKVPRVV